MDEAVPNVDAAQTALVLMDFQPAVLGTVAESDMAALLANAGKALTWARSAGLTVAHVRVAFRDADYAAIPEHNRTFAPFRGGGILADGSPECEIVESLRPAPDEVKSLLVVPVATLLDPSVHSTEKRRVGDQDYRIHYYTVGDDIIWGATGRIVYQFLKVWQEAA